MQEKDIYKKSRELHILDAAFEYFITILVSGAYLAKITSAIGISDSLTGILSAFVSLGCGFQIIAVFLANKQPVKRWLTPLYCLTHTCFGILCFIRSIFAYRQYHKPRIKLT